MLEVEKSAEGSHDGLCMFCMFCMLSPPWMNLSCLSRVRSIYPVFFQGDMIWLFSASRLWVDLGLVKLRSGT